MLSTIPLISYMTFLPLLGVVFIFFMKKPHSDEAEVLKNFHHNVWSVGLLISCVTFLLSLLILYEFNDTKGFQLVEKVPISSFLTMTYHMGLDGVSLVFVLLTTFLMPLSLLASMKSIKTKVNTYVMAFLILETMMLGVFSSLDMIFFYIFFEGVLIPMFLIIGIWGGARRVYSSFKFFLYTFLGSIFMLVAMIHMAQETGTTSIPILQNHVFSPTLQPWLWLAFFVSFAIKVPMWPCHTWLPDAHVEAPTAGSVILAGILLKMGGYGFFRFSLPMFPDASHDFAPFVCGLSIVAVIYTSVIALVQKDMKKLIAYASIAHMGLVTFGLFTFHHQGVSGALFQMISHGLVSAALFLCVGVLYDRTHTREIEAYGGCAKKMPLCAIGFLIFTFASIGLPGTVGFVGEILVMMAAFHVGGVWALLLGTGMILGAAYALSLYRRVMLGPEKDLKLMDLTGVEKIIFALLVSIIIAGGIYPKPLLNLMDLPVQTLLNKFSNHER